MASLFSRRGDSQVLKALIAASLSKKTVELTLLADATTVRSKGASNPFSTNTIAYRDVNNAYTEANVIAKLIGGSSLCSIDPDAINRWLDWEQSTLRTVLLSCVLPTLDETKLNAALNHIEDGLSKSGSFITGSSISLADIALYCSLLPITNKVSLSPTLQAYIQWISSLPEVKEATKRSGCDDPEALLSSFREDVKASSDRRPKLPIPGQRNILITSALPYVNNVPHLGNIIGCVLSADCYSRFCRARGHNSIFVCGTDEYGTATETKAMEEGMTPQQICDKYHAIHRDIYEWFDIGFDKFGRTPSRAQTEICQTIFQSLKERGCLVEQSMEQLYSEALGKFLADRFVVGTCPKCKYEDARGDQCDACGNLLNPTELINPKCKFSGTKPVIRSTSHIFLDLPQLSPKLQEYINTTSQMGGWSSNCIQVTGAWMRDGLKNRCITRDLKWGTPVPMEGFEDKVFYVWFDAPIGYISITANYTPEWEKWWKNPDDVEMVQFMGKDNVPFHTVIFPATLLGTGDPWTMMRSISVTEYLNYEGGKFSKSRGTGVFGSDAKDTGIPVEVWRYYLLSNRPEQQDTDFKWSDLAARNNSELLSNVGNFANRALQFVVKFFEGKIPEHTAGSIGGYSPDTDAEIVALGSLIGPKVKEYVSLMEKIKIRDAIKVAMSISTDGNKFIQDSQPWVVVKTDRARCAGLVSAAVGVARLLAALLSPYMPSLARKLLDQMALSDDALLITDALIESSSLPHTLIPSGHQIGTPAPLVTMISDETIEGLRARFGGSQAERDTKASAAASGSTAPSQGGNTSKAATAPGLGSKDGKKGGEEKKPSKEAEGPLDVSRLDIRVGLIKKAWRHPDAESLYVEEIDVGEGQLQPRQVVSGLVKYIPENEMQSRLVCVLCNLKPANMRGVQSQAMVLAATSPDGLTVELVEPPAGSKPGERVTFEGYPGEPDEQLNPKKKVFEAIQPDLAVGDDLVAKYKGVAFMTSLGPCKVKSAKGASIK